MKSISYFFFFLTILFSCKSLSSLGLRDHPVVPVHKKNPGELNGLYSNKHYTICGKLRHIPSSGHNELEKSSALTQLIMIVPDKFYRDESGEIIKEEDKWIKLEFSSKNKASIGLYRNETLMFSKTIHGKFRNNYFYLRPKAFVLPFVPLLFGYNFERARIGKSGNNLIIDYSVNRWGFALVAGGSDKGYTSSVYKSKAK